MPLYQAGQSMAFDGLGLVGAREFPLGFLNPAVPPVCTPATPAQLVGGVSLLTAALYGIGGSLDGKIFHFTIDGAPTISFALVAPPDVTTLLATINAQIGPEAVASVQPGTSFLVLTTTATGSTASLMVSGDAATTLLVPGTLATGTDAVPGVPAVPVVSRSQLRAFRGERLVVPSDIAASFSLLDVKVGNRSQFANSVQIPAETFVEGAVGVRLSLATAVTAMDIALIVANQTGAPLAFRATIIGTTFV